MRRRASPPPDPSFYVDVDLCCNYPRNGDHSGQVVMVTLKLRFDNGHEELLTIEGPPIACRLLDRDRLRFGRRIFPLYGYTFWAGYWCWDMATLEHSDAVALLNICKLRGWRVDDGVTSLFHKFDAPGKLLEPRDLEIEWRRSLLARRTRAQRALRG